MEGRWNSERWRDEKGERMVGGVRGGGMGGGEDKSEKAAVEGLNLSHFLFKDLVILKSSLSSLAMKAEFSMRVLNLS